MKEKQNKNIRKKVNIGSKKQKSQKSSQLKFQNDSAGPLQSTLPTDGNYKLATNVLKKFLKKRKKKQTQLPEHSELKKTEK